MSRPHTDRVVLKWCEFDGDKPREYYRLRCISDDGYDWEGRIQRRLPGKEWEDYSGDFGYCFTDLAICLDREKGVTLPAWGRCSRRKKG